MPVPEVPMTTTVVEGCAITPPPGSLDSEIAESNQQDQQEGAAPVTTLTIPCASAISELDASASAYASATAGAGASEGANSNAHAPVPYSFPISFPMATSAPAPAIVTLNLVAATAKFNFSVPANTSSSLVWSDEVKNVTVVPVALSPLTSTPGGVASASASVSAMASAGAGGMRSGAEGGRVFWSWILAGVVGLVVVSVSRLL